MSEFRYSEFLLEEAKRIRGTAECEDFLTYMRCPDEEKKHVDKNTRTHYQLVRKTLSTMQHYKQNHWWTTDDTDLTTTLRKKVRVYFQVFDLGLDFFLVNPRRLCDDINSLLAGKSRVPVATWMIRYHKTFFDRIHRELLQEILENDTELQNFLHQLAPEDSS